MTNKIKPRTMKDLKIHNGEKVRQEAIRWINAMEGIIDNYHEETNGRLSIKTVTKRLREIGFNGWYTKNEPLKFADETILLEARGAIEWIKLFFNIEDE